MVSSFPRGDVKVQVSSGGGDRARWRRDGSELFYVSARGQLMAASLHAGPGQLSIGSVRPLFDMPATASNDRYYDVSADGQRFLFAIRGLERPKPEPIHVIVNWPALLRK
jgi:hypothetical protein